MIKITTIKSKLVIAFVSVASLVAIVGVVGIVNSFHIYAALNVVANDPLPELLISNKIQSSVNKISSDIVGFALVSPVTKQLHQQRLQQITQDSNMLASLVDQLDKISPDSKERAESDPALKYLTNEYSTVSLQLFNSKYNGMNEQSILNLISYADNLRNKIDIVMNKRINVENTEIQNEITKANGSILTQQEEIIIASIAAYAASIAIGRHISMNSIIKPLLKLKQATVQIAHGDFVSVELKGLTQDDEIGELSIQFDNMRQTLDQTTRELESSNIQLSLANEQLKVNDKMQRDFINIAAHELRTPIEPILMGSEQLKDERPKDEIVSIIFRNAKKLQALANAILDVAKIESGNFRLYKERVNIKDIISDALEIIITTTTNNGGSLYNKDNSRLNIIYDPKDIFIEADKGRMTQVVCNLLNNAMKFIKKEVQEPVISIITQRKEGEDNEVVVSIKDNGQGIDPDMLPKLFTKFASKSDIGGGTGLGLFISKSIVEAHGGRIWTENNKNGEKGATFYFTLPLLR